MRRSSSPVANRHTETIIASSSVATETTLLLSEMQSSRCTRWPGRSRTVPSRASAYGGSGSP